MAQFCDRFGVTVRSLWCHFVYFEVTFGLLSVYVGDFGITFVRFRKTFIFPIDLNDFMQLWGQLVVIFDHFGLTLSI